MILTLVPTQRSRSLKPTKRSAFQSPGDAPREQLTNLAAAKRCGHHVDVGSELHWLSTIAGEQSGLGRQQLARRVDQPLMTYENLLV